jgi:hypothetical protein
MSKRHRNRRQLRNRKVAPPSPHRATATVSSVLASHETQQSSLLSTDHNIAGVVELHDVVSSESRSARSSPSFMGVLLAVCTIIGAVLAPLALWPKLSLSVVPGNDAVWLYTVRNESLFPLSNLRALGHLKSIQFPWTGGEARLTGFCPDYAWENVSRLRPGDEHTFRCPAFAFDPSIVGMAGRVEIHAKYRYLSVFERSVDACFELEQLRSNMKYHWLRKACA